MNVLGIIPARFASSRFPGKPLADIGGQTMIERVYRQARQASMLDDVIIATDDRRIFDHVLQFGATALMTATDHRSGTDRCAEVLRRHAGSWDVVINIQGDEPFIRPAQIDAVASLFKHADVQIATAIRETDAERAANPDLVKVVVDAGYRALYFSRAVIPFRKQAGTGAFSSCYVHVGLYGYRAPVLDAISRLSPGMLETAESLEQLRWLENGYPVQTVVTQEASHAVDTPDDLERVKSTFGL